jgi:hypothetical protein
MGWTVRGSKWALINIAVKCRALLLRRMWVQTKKRGTVTATWRQTWDLEGQQGNPQYAGRIPSRIAYLKYEYYALDMAYIEPPWSDEAPTHFKRRVYDTLEKVKLATRRTMEMWVIQKSPYTDWDRVWRNVHASCWSEAVQSARYLVIHDLIPTNERLATIHMVDSDTCRQCGRPETLTHLLMECDNGPGIWDWTLRQVATMIRTYPRHIPKKWVLRPQFRFWTPLKQRANDMDSGPHGLVPNARTAAPITNRGYRLHEEIEMESIPEPKTTPTNWKLSGSAINNTREQRQDNSNTTGTRELSNRKRGNQVIWQRVTDIKRNCCLCNCVLCVK